jgi:Trypsin-like peptidase domain
MSSVPWSTNFSHTGFDSPISEFAVMLVGRDERKCSPFGTGVIIGPHIAITARHVIDEFFQEHEGVDPREREHLIDAKFAVQALHFLEKGTKVSAWDVRKIYTLDGNDIAFLQLAPTLKSQLSYSWRGIVLQLLPPPVGASIAAFGYHSNEVEISDGQIKVSTNPYTSIGRVQEVHDQQRDNLLLPWPCFRTDARFERAMSGGPVFTKEGVLCGIICKSFELESSEIEHISYASSLWPAMATMVDYDREDAPRGLTYPALELAKTGFIFARDWHKVIVRQDIKTGHVGASIISLNAT